MKTTAALVAFVALASTAVACAAPSGSAEDEAAQDQASAQQVSSAEAEVSSAAISGKSVLRGSFQAYGESYTLEIEVVSKQNVSQMKFCDPFVSQDDTEYAGSSASPLNRDERGGTIRTIVRDANEKIIGESSADINSFSTYARLDYSANCSVSGKVTSRQVTEDFENITPLAWVQGAVAQTPKGEIWVVPSYGGVGREFVNLNGTAKYRAISSAASATFRPRPFSGKGQELHFAKGELALTTGKTLSIEVGSDIQGEGFKHATKTEYVQVTRQ